MHPSTNIDVCTIAMEISLLTVIVAGIGITVIEMWRHKQEVLCDQEEEAITVEVD